MLEFTSVNVRNFLEFIRFQAAAGDEILKRHVSKASSNAKYMSKTIWNELICLRGEEIVTGIISEVKESRVFSTLADEVRHTEQMSFVIRFVDKSCQIREEFIQFLECESGTSGHELYLKRHASWSWTFSTSSKATLYHSSWNISILVLTLWNWAFTVSSKWYACNISLDFFELILLLLKCMIKCFLWSQEQQQSQNNNKIYINLKSSCLCHH